MTDFKSDKHRDSPKQATVGKITFPFFFFFTFPFRHNSPLKFPELLRAHFSTPELANGRGHPRDPSQSVFLHLISLLLRVLQNLLVTENEAGWRSLVLESS